MPKIPQKPAVLAAALATVALLAACGSSTTKTVTVTQTQTQTQTLTQTATSASSSSTSTTATTTTATSTATTPPASTSSSTTTRTATGPAFVGTTTTPSGALGAAVALLSRKGYTPVDAGSYQAGDTLRVLIGRAAGGERAFFFDQGTYLGTDASTASAQITVRGQNDTEVTLVYATYAAGTATPNGSRRVRFALDMGQLSPLDPIPSVALRR